MKILINAYACSPNMGSEPGMAWNWVSNLAKFCELYIITEGEFREKIEEVVPTLEWGKNMHFYYNPVSEDIRKMCWTRVTGDFISIIASGNGRHILWRRIYALKKRLMCCINLI